MAKTKNYQELSTDELKNELNELMTERFGMKMQKITGQAVKSHVLKQQRLNIARIKTILSEKGVKV